MITLEVVVNVAVGWFLVSVVACLLLGRMFAAVGERDEETKPETEPKRRRSAVAPTR